MRERLEAMDALRQFNYAATAGLVFAEYAKRVLTGQPIFDGEEAK